jgi:transcriptional regulator of acetoin/glycerol metabolism
LRRGAALEVRDLPGDTFATVRQVLTSLGAIECDAIVNALLEAEGNKARAAQRLGTSRATIYRKIRGRRHLTADLTTSVVPAPSGSGWRAGCGSTRR